MDNANPNPYSVIPEPLKVQVLREYVLFKRQPYHWAVTISPPLMDSKQFVKEIAYIRHLFGKKYMFTVESDKGRLHLHGLFAVRKHDYELMKQYEDLITKLVGFCKVKIVQRTEKAVLGWLQYMFKDNMINPVYIDQHTESMVTLESLIDSYIFKRNLGAAETGEAEGRDTPTT